VLEHVLTQHEVGLAGARAKGRGVRKQLARDRDPRLVAQLALQLVGTRVLGLDQQELGCPGLEDPSREGADPGAHLDDAALHVPAELLEHPVA